MAADPLEDVLRLVAEGRLTAEEAAPILAALDDQTAAEPGPARAGSADGDPAPGGEFGEASSEGTGSTLRLEIRESGRQVVQLRLPLAIGRAALDRVPGLSGEQVESVKAALRSGVRGPLLEVDDGPNSVRIVVD